MPRLLKSRITSILNRPAGRAGGSDGAGGAVHLYGWDSQSETWHGPDEPGCRSLPDMRLLEALRSAPGKSWYGPVNCRVPGEPPARFFTMVHDLSDCAIASIYCGESKAGPAELVAVIPANRRRHLRDEFAFEFVAFARFLNALGEAAELRVHDAIASAVAEAPDGGAVVFTIGSGLWPTDSDAVLSSCVEKIALTLCRWLEDTTAPGKRSDASSITAA